MKYIALLRGINVGGHRKILMKDLISVYEGLGYADVRTYIQSGNVAFSSKKAANTLEKEQQTAIKKHFGHDVTVMIRTQKEIQEVLKNNPFGESAYILYLSKEVDAKKTRLLDKKISSHDKYKIAGNHMYLLYDGGAGTSKMTTALIEKIFGVEGTARNLRTSKKLLEF